MSECKKPQADTKTICLRNMTYNPVSGEIKWVKTNNQYTGAAAGSKRIDKNGKAYVRIYVCGRLIPAHVIAWLHITGEWCPGEVDHINGDGTDNRKDNLRRVTHSDNCKNKRRMKNNTSGACGVCYRKREKKWEARINVNGKRHVLGLFATKDDAATARAAANVEFGFHPNHGTDRPL